MPSGFKDLNGREWPVTVDGGAVVRVKNATGILLTELIGGDAANQVAANPPLLMSILYAVCQPDAVAKDVSEEKFYAGLGGDGLEDATDALIAGIVNFFPKARRPVVQKIIDKGKQISEAAALKMIQTLDEMTPESLLDKLPGNDSGNAPASSASTRPTSLSAS